MAKYADPAAERLLHRHVKLFLVYRCKSLYGAPEVLPNLVRNVVEHFMTATSQASGTDREAYMDRVCDAIVNHCRANMLSSLAIKPTPIVRRRFASDPIQVYCLAIAILMKEKELVSHYLSQGVSVWDSTAIFEMPLKVAAKLEAIEFVAQLLEDAKSSLTKSNRAKSMSHLRIIINRTTRSEHWDIAIIVIDWWFRHLRKPHPATIVSWVKKAAIVPTTEFLHRILDHGHTSATKHALVELLYCHHAIQEDGGRSRLARALIDRNILDPSKYYSHPGAVFGSLLALAVEQGDIKLATGYLKLDLSPNGLRNSEGNFEHPLVRAVVKSDETMVRLLLDHDADPQPAQRWISKVIEKPDEEPTKSFMDLLRCDWRAKMKPTLSIVAMVRQAAQAKDRRRKEAFTEA